MKPVSALVLTAALCAGVAVEPLAAQNHKPAAQGAPDRRAPPPPAPAPEPRSDISAGQTQSILFQVLQQYPPSLTRVLRLDPTLLTNTAYLEPYPRLAEFLAAHPEIAHNPSFFLGDSRDVDRSASDPRMASIRMMEDVMAGFAVLTGILAVVGTIAWLLRSVIEHRRWLRVSKTHTDTHTKLLDRLTSNEDLMAYMQSPAGRRFLEAAPIPLGVGPRALSAPIGRILWSVQAGCVVAFAGLGLMFASRRFSIAGYSDIELPILVAGTTAVAIGIGFMVSAAIAYGLSRQLGLLAPKAHTPGADLEIEPRPLS